MYNLIQELEEFKKYHKNKFNIYFHIICGLIYMTLLIGLNKKFSNILLLIYSLLLLIFLDINKVLIIILFMYISLLQVKNLSFNNKITLIIIFYLLPEVSHYITDEPTVLKIENLNPISLFINIFYLLPFGILSLSNTK